MQSECRACRKAFEVSAADLKFLAKISPRFSGRLFPVPPPACCPDCRLARRLAYRNEYFYFSRSCDLCAQKIVSIHAADAPYPVYCHSCWWGDSWDPLAYGRPYQPGRSFFDQFADLRTAVPQLAMMNDNGVSSENCEYCQDFAFGKNCYLVTASWEDRDCMYCSQCNGDVEVFDSFLVNHSELVCQSLIGDKLYNCAWLIAAGGCTDCFFGYDLHECRNCIGCVGLRQAQYCLFNEQLSQAEYERRVAALQLHSRRGLDACRTRFAEFSRQFPRRAVHQLSCENSQGDALQHCKNFQGFAVINGEDSRFIWQGDGVQHSLDLQVTGRAQWCYEGATVDNAYLTNFSMWSWKSKHLLYCDNCHSCENLLGCIGLRRKANCILNRQYAAKDYERLAAQMLQEMSAAREWGEFFPIVHAPFAYNESRAQDLSPLERQEALNLGLRWRDPEPRAQQPAAAVLPESILQCGDEIAGSVLSCVSCPKNYRINKAELAFYRKLSLPLPEECPDCRRQARFTRYPSSGRLYQRPCRKCRSIVSSAFSEADCPMVLCEGCYQEAL